MEYQILTSSSIYGLDQDVRKLIEDGWKPSGGIASSQQVIKDPRNKLYFETDFHQAMIKSNPIRKRILKFFRLKK